MKQLKKGFTLIEILVVIGIIAILAAIVLIAINPARQFAQANNSQRTSNVNAILNAIGQYMADNQGNIPADIPSGDPDVPGEYDEISSADADLCDDLVPDYLPALPTDPKLGDPAIDDCGGTYDTDYTVIQDEDTDRIYVCAPKTELGGDEICVVR